MKVDIFLTIWQKQRWTSKLFLGDLGVTGGDILSKVVDGYKSCIQSRHGGKQEQLIFILQVNFAHAAEAHKPKNKRPAPTEFALPMSTFCGRIYA
jgi:hypothetical protein